ncbi:F-box domain-containing protein [Mycena indigotica]|uniref:F-box domain-containing protein n=1 Tax=Mycena indigotica TaxID=2126181 RepID=A0A8H6S9W6_9AGAR|nr:F-box domain-containing protein [Mycena indigotica]KAF7295671.1 F-box domain-containing protein [Mycena indigotica]
MATLLPERKRLEELEEEIIGLELRLSALRDEVFTVKQRMNNYVYPVLTLPNEIVSMIFLHYVPAYPCRPSILGEGSPILLTRICRHWRDIADSTPRLWCSIRLFHFQTILRPPLASEVPRSLKLAADRKTAQLHLELAEKWMEKSGALPLSIELGVDVDNYGDYYNLMGLQLEALRLIMRYHKRWQYIQFRLPVKPALTGVAKRRDRLTITDCFPLLRELHIEFDNYPAFLVLIEAPHLERATFDNTDLGPLSTLSRPPSLFNNLTQLILLRFDLLSAVWALRYAPCLQRCWMNVTFVIEGEDHHSDFIEPVFLGQLTTLAIRLWMGECDYMSDFLGSLRTPRLERLCIEEDFLDPDPIDTLSNLIESGSLQLKELLVITPKRTGPQYARAFSQIPRVRRVIDIDLSHNRDSAIAEEWGFVLGEGVRFDYQNDW